MFSIGIDIAKANHEVCLLNAQKQVVGAPSFPVANTHKGFLRLRDYLLQHGFSPEKAQVGMEATGHYWQTLYTWLAQQGYTILLFNPITTDAIRRSKLRHTKTDRIDARVIARLVLDQEHASVPLLEEESYSLKVLTRHRNTLVTSRSRLKCQALAVLDLLFAEYAALFPDPFCLSSRTVLMQYPSPEALATVSLATLTTLLERVSRKRYGQEKANALLRAARESVGLTFGTDVFTTQIQQHLAQMDLLDLQIQQTEADIARRMEKMNSTIQSIPGIGPTYGAKILGELGDVHRFASGKQIVSYAGLESGTHQSGKFTGTQERMSKRGSPFLRYALWGAAQKACMHDPELQRYYQGLRERGKPYKVAVTAVARKMCYILYAILSENRPYEIRS